MNASLPAEAALPESLRRLNVAEGAGSLVFMPDFGGNTIYARPLVTELAADCSCYAVQLTPELVSSLPGLSIEEMGRQFAEAIAAAQLPRPLHVLGFSFAGYLAHETARQLALLGDAPDTVWLLDLARYRPLNLGEVLRRPLYHAADILRYLKANRRRLLFGKQEPDMLAAYGVSRMDLTRHPESYREIIRCNYAALLDYRPKPATAPTILLRAMHEPRSLNDKAMGWQEYMAGPFQVIGVPGDHLSMLREPGNARAVAQVIRKILLQVPLGEDRTFDADKSC